MGWCLHYSRRVAVLSSLHLTIRAWCTKFLPSFALGDELKCSTPRAQRTGSTTHWKDVYTGLAEMLSPADGLVGDMLTKHLFFCLCTIR